MFNGNVKTEKASCGVQDAFFQSFGFRAWQQLRPFNKQMCRKERKGNKNMAIQFIFGAGGSRKSDYLYRIVVRRSQEEKRQFFVIVPEQFTMETQKKLCAVHPSGGIMNIDVQSFERLAHRIFEELCVPRRIFLDDECKNLLLRSIVQENKESLRALGGKLMKPGYISEIKSVISELMQYGVDVAMLEKAAKNTDDSMLTEKLEDMALLYRSFIDRLGSVYTVKEELLERLGSCVCRSGLLRDSVIALYGFTGFTPVQLRLMGELLDICHTMYVTVDIPADVDPFTYRSPFDLFGMSKKMTTDLTALAKGRNIRILPSIRLDGGEKTGTSDRKYADTVPGANQGLEDSVFDQYPKAELPLPDVNPMLDDPVSEEAHIAQELVFLRQNIFRYTRKVFSGQTQRIVTASFTDPEAEADAAALTILDFLRKNPETMYRQIAVVCTDMTVYGDLLERAFFSYHIPFFMDDKKSVLQNGFVEYVRALTDMIVQSFSYESVFRFLRTGYFSFDGETPRETRALIDELENYVLAHGIRGFKNWSSPWLSGDSRFETAYMEKINSCRAIFCERLTDIVEVLTRKRKTVALIVKKIYSYCLAEGVFSKVDAQAQQFEERGELALAKEYGQIGGIVTEVLEKLYELAGDTHVALRDFAELLDAGLEEAKVAVIPPALDQVLVGDLQRTRVSDIRMLILLGAGDTLLPGKLKSEGLLSEADREKLREFLTLSPGVGEKLFMQKFYLYLALSKPSEALYISYSRRSRDGKSVRPSYLIPELRRLYPRLKEEQGLFSDSLSGHRALHELADGFRERRGGISPRVQEIYRYYTEKEDAETGLGHKEKIEAIMAGAFSGKERGKISAKLAKRLYTEGGVSATRLEKFAKCAYAHFLTYGLRLRERSVHEFAALDWGNMAHRAMELFAAAAMERGVQWKELDESAKTAMIAGAVNQCVEENKHTILFENARNEYMITLLGRLLHRSVWALSKQLEAGEFFPAAGELSFGNGKIDRVDVSEQADKVYVRVIDYKTGNVGFDIVAFVNGLQLQLPVYLDAAVRWAQSKWEGKEIIASGLFYYRMDDPLVNRENQKKDEENLLRQLRLDGIRQADETVERLMDRSCARYSLYTKGSRLEEDDFRCMMEYAGYKQRELEERIRAGEITPHPYEYKDRTACDYCSYAVVCGFDPTDPSMRYRVIDGQEPEQALESMRQYVQQKKDEKSNGQNNGKAYDKKRTGGEAEHA